MIAWHECGAGSTRHIWYAAGMDTYHRGRRIREMRRAANLSREALAVRAGISGSTVMRAEQGKGVGLESLAAILAVLDPEARIADYAGSRS